MMNYEAYTVRLKNNDRNSGRNLPKKLLKLQDNNLSDAQKSTLLTLRDFIKHKYLLLK